jgi:hypothetical protein
MTLSREINPVLTPFIPDVRIFNISAIYVILPSGHFPSNFPTVSFLDIPHVNVFKGP